MKGAKDRKGLCPRRLLLSCRIVTCFRAFMRPLRGAVSGSKTQGGEKPNSEFTCAASRRPRAQVGFGHLDGGKS